MKTNEVCLGVQNVVSNKKFALCVVEENKKSITVIMNMQDKWKSLQKFV
jgi:hypothetical protein